MGTIQYEKKLYVEEEIEIATAAKELTVRIEAVKEGDEVILAMFGQPLRWILVDCWDKSQSLSCSYASRVDIPSASDTTKLAGAEG